MDDNEIKDTKCRKWQLTINNPIENGFSHQRIKDILNKFNLKYWCMSDEIGEEKTLHTHVYVYFNKPVRFSTLKNQFSAAHIEDVKGTSQQNRDYIFKEGKWLNDKKHETNLIDTHEEYGECPVETPGKRNDLIELYDMIKTGMTNSEILDIKPEHMDRIDKIDKARMTYLQGRYKNIRRLDIQVTYVCGSTGTGKTRDIMDLYGDENVYRVTDYLHPFDGYECQDVIVFEEFRNSLKIQDMLNYLDVYPVVLPSRYNNRVACYTKVFIVSNWDLREQFLNIQQDYIETWKAFLRRIQKVKKYSIGCEPIECDTDNYLNGFTPIIDNDNPFLDVTYNQTSII